MKSIARGRRFIIDHTHSLHGFREYFARSAISSTHTSVVAIAHHGVESVSARERSQKWLEQNHS